MGTVVGVAAGLAIGIKTKSMKPLVGFGFMGSTADLAFGYFNACSDIIEDFITSKRDYDLKEKQRAVSASSTEKK